MGHAKRGDDLLSKINKILANIKKMAHMIRLLLHSFCIKIYKYFRSWVDFCLGAVYSVRFIFEWS